MRESAIDFFNRWLVRVSAVMIIVGGAILAYWQWFDRPQLNRVYEQRIMNPESIYPGGRLVMRIHACNFAKPVANSAMRFITNEFIFRIADTSVADIGCFNREVSYVIPSDAHRGPHTYQFCAEWRVNPIKTLLQCNPPIKFNVIIPTSGPAVSR